LEQEHGTWLNLIYSVLPFLQARVGVQALAAVLMAALVSVAGYVALRERRRIPSGAQTFFEILYDFIDNLTHQMIGEDGSRYTPLIASLFLYIFCLNIFGLVPGFISPTTSLSTTLALALAAFTVVQFYGFRQHGIRYLAHFVGGLPIRQLWWLAWFLVPFRERFRRGHCHRPAGDVGRAYPRPDICPFAAAAPHGADGYFLRCRAGLYLFDSDNILHRSSCRRTVTTIGCTLLRGQAIDFGGVHQ